MDRERTLQASGADSDGVIDERVCARHAGRRGCNRDPRRTPRFAEWQQVRAGCITGSMFVTARQRLKSGPSKGDYTAAAKDYAFRLPSSASAALRSMKA